MKVLVQRIYAHPNYSKISGWVRLVTITGSAQVLIQLIGLVSGILVIRLLTTNEYALYTLANTMLGTMTVLADAGIATSVLAEGGKVWKDRQKFGAVLSTGLYLRKKFAIVSLFIATPILLYLLMDNHAGWLMSVVLFISLIPAFFSSLSGYLLEIGPKLHQDISPLQKIQIGANVARLLLLTLSLFVLPLAFIAVLAAGIPQLFANMRLRKISAVYADWHQKYEPETASRILKNVKKLFPEAMYYCFSGQITLWLISIFGTTAAIAQIGALGRLAITLNLFSVLFGILIMPRFARLPNKQDLLLRRYLQILTGTLILSVLIVITVWLFSSQVLWVLGDNYISLNKEVVLIIINACLGLLYGISFNLSTCRGWVINPIIIISASLVSILCAALLFNVSTLQGVIWFNIAISLVQVIIITVYNFIRIARS
jgi:O-antigen/teichoic acid export membrane protein